MKKRMGFLAVVLWAVGLVACAAGEPGGEQEENGVNTEKTGEATEPLCASGTHPCNACGHTYCEDNGIDCAYCFLFNGVCECQ
jgi:hypothetical protein